MGIAETDKKSVRELSEAKAQKARYRSFLKRRSAQMGNSCVQSNWSLCTNLQRQWRRRRVRRLFAAEKTQCQNSTQPYNLKQQTWSFFWYTLVPLLLVLCFSCGITLYQNTDAVSKFIQRYSVQYQAIVHNKLNYCDRHMPLHDMFQQIRLTVINQDVALKQLEQALSIQSSFQSIALVGTSGVGKSLTMRTLQEQFPWSENIQTVAWNDFELIDNEARYRVITKLLGNLAHCGRNLIIIDNMAMCDLEYVTSINAMVHSTTGVASGNKKLLTIIYVFNLNGMLLAEYSNQQLQMLQSLPTTTVISYRMFGLEDLERCVRHEVQQVGVDLDERYVDILVNTTNVKVSGCKTVRAKVLMYGQTQSKVEPMKPNENDNLQVEFKPKTTLPLYDF